MTRFELDSGLAFVGHFGRDGRLVRRCRCFCVCLSLCRRLACVVGEFVWPDATVGVEPRALRCVFFAVCRFAAPGDESSERLVSLARLWRFVVGE